MLVELQYILVTSNTNEQFCGYIIHSKKNELTNKMWEQTRTSSTFKIIISFIQISTCTKKIKDTLKLNMHKLWKLITDFVNNLGN